MATTTKLLPQLKPRRTAKPTWQVENAIWREGFTRVAGVDEVGRGPLAGPVVAGAVVLPYSRARWVGRLRDSKLLDAPTREELAAEVRAHCDWGIGVVSPQVIDQLGMTRATRLAMRRAVLALPVPPDALIVDGREVVECEAPQRAVIDGDALCPSVAAASIVAKVARDAMMDRLDARFAGYGFASNKGYATPDHRRALREIGPSNVHRMLFAPVLDALRARSARITGSAAGRAA
ncbi:MAG: ribonuclease HII [Chloroflexi bacterium]|nr:ribonuclease HII [Chloroflexota bacterium]